MLVYGSNKFSFVVVCVLGGCGGVCVGVGVLPLWF